MRLILAAMVLVSAAAVGQNITWLPDGGFVCGAYDAKGNLKTSGIPCHEPTAAEIAAHKPKPSEIPHNFDYIVAGIEHYKKDSDVMEYVLSNPETAACSKAGWPNTPDCNRLALGVVRTLRKYLDNKLVGVRRPPFPPDGAKR